MIDRSSQIHSFVAASEKAAADLSMLHHIERTPAEVRDALVVVLGVEDQIALLDLDLDANAMIGALRTFSFAKPILLAEVELEESIIPDGVPIRLVEALAKHRNEIWLVHKYDADPFPSNPHAHNEDNGLKLHLGTGGLYRRREFVGSIRRKDLLVIRGKLSSIELPPLDADAS